MRELPVSLKALLAKNAYIKAKKPATSGWLLDREVVLYLIWQI